MPSMPLLDCHATANPFFVAFTFHLPIVAMCEYFLPLAASSLATQNFLGLICWIRFCSFLFKLFIRNATSSFSHVSRFSLSLYLILTDSAGIGSLPSSSSVFTLSKSSILLLQRVVLDYRSSRCPLHLNLPSFSSLKPLAPLPCASRLLPIVCKLPKHLSVIRFQHVLDFFRVFFRFLENNRRGNDDDDRACRRSLCGLKAFACCFSFASSSWRSSAVCDEKKTNTHGRRKRGVVVVSRAAPPGLLSSSPPFIETSSSSSSLSRKNISRVYKKR